MRYRYLKPDFLLPNFVTSQLYSLEMGRKMIIINLRYGFEGNFKLIIKMMATMATLTLLYVNCKEAITNF